jgi:hypothetical protein
MRYITNSEKSLNHSKILNEWKIAIGNGDYERAIQLDFFHYTNLVKANEDVNYWDKWQSDTFSVRVNICKKHTELSPNRDTGAIDYANKFAIVHHNYSGLAHEVQLSRNIQFLRRQGFQLDFDVIYLFDCSADSRSRAAQLYQIPESNLIFLLSNSYRNASVRLNDACRHTNYRTVIYPSIFFLAFWMSLFNTHPRQKFLQMKYYPLQVGRIAQWAGGKRTASESYSIHGFDFTQLETLDLSSEQAVARGENRKSPSGLTFGSISRPEKIADVNYNKFVESVLYERPSLTYLYTGHRKDLPVIPDTVLQMRNSCYIGWVEPVVAIRDYTIYVEPFPWGGGEMSFLALRSGVPYLSLGTQENIQYGVFDVLRLVADSGPAILQYSFCMTQDELRSKLLQLADELPLRQALGDAWRSHIKGWRPNGACDWIDFLMN